MDVPEALERFKQVAASLEEHIAVTEARAKSLWKRWELYVIATVCLAAGAYLGYRVHA